MRNILLVLIMTIPSFNTFAYEGLPREQIKKFFKDVGKGQANEAIDRLYSENPVLSANEAGKAVIKQQTASAPAIFGAFLGHENVHVDKLSDSVVRYVEIAKYANHPITWEFYFYKPKDKWFVVQCGFIDRFQIIDSKM